MKLDLTQPGKAEGFEEEVTQALPLLRWLYFPQKQKAGAGSASILAGVKPGHGPDEARLQGDAHCWQGTREWGRWN